MEQIKQLIASLSLKQRIVIGAAAAVVIAGIVAAAAWARARDFKPLYTNLGAEDAGAVVAKIHESGTEYRLAANGSTVLVPSAKVDELRLQLAAAGIPKTGRIGYELFDKTNFGATDFTEQLNYHRALEGELERTMMALSEVEQARVHLTFPKESIFSEERQPAKASVVLKLRIGAKLTPQNVSAICHLTASAVEGLLPENVSVLDMNGNLLNRPRAPGSQDGPDPSEAGLEYRQKIERDLLAKINATVEPLVGASAFRSGISVDCDFTSGDQSEETFDPARSVMVTSQRTEDLSGGALSGGIPGSPSNLPRPTSRPGSGRTGTSRRTENIAYQTSRVVRHIRIPQGGIKRLSASILVDYIVSWQGAGAKARRIVTPPPAEKLKSIRDLVAAAIGLVPERGDQLVVEALPFDVAYGPAPPEAPAAAPQHTGFALPDWAFKYRKFAIGGAVALMLFLALGVLFLRARRRRRKAVLKAKAELEAAAATAKALAPVEEASKQLESRIAEQNALKQKAEAEALLALKLPPVTTKKSEVLGKHIGESAKKDPALMVHVLRSWLEEDK
ncbi:MAG TPA: flagellar basal-body MS-ring/collar protein FliF [Bryobacteraceae bacterium]|nr:flagellar basal-body MS-ring/collar protein FliF [Bryobacteraceae bacterium]